MSSTGYDMILKGGTLYGSPGFDGTVADVAVSGQRIAAVAADLGTDAAEVVDCRGRTVVPGLVDLHCHVAKGDDGNKKRVPVADGHLLRGATAINDAGSTGLATFETFRDDIIAAADLRLVAYLSVAPHGSGKTEAAELAEPGAIRVDDMVAMVSKNPDILRGIKVRVSADPAGDRPIELLRSAIEVAGQCGVPVMVHIGNTTCPLADVLEVLRPGDIVTHCFHGKGEGVVQGGRVIDAVWQARARGVLFDTGHGTTQMSYAVTRTAFAEGFFPDAVSSDLSRNNWWGPAYDLVTVVSKFAALGMPMAELIRASATRPAAILHLREEGYGLLAEGNLASVLVLDQSDEAEPLPDSSKEMVAARRFEPAVILNRGARVPVTTWRGSPEAELAGAGPRAGTS